MIDQQEWTKDTENALSKMAGDPGAVEQFHGDYAKQLEETVDLVRGQLTKLQRRCVGLPSHPANNLMEDAFNPKLPRPHISAITFAPRPPPLWALPLVCICLLF